MATRQPRVTGCRIVLVVAVLAAGFTSGFWSAATAAEVRDFNIHREEIVTHYNAIAGAMLVAGGVDHDVRIQSFHCGELSNGSQGCELGIDRYLSVTAVGEAGSNITSIRFSTVPLVSYAGYPASVDFLQIAIQLFTRRYRDDPAGAHSYVELAIENALDSGNYQTLIDGRYFSLSTDGSLYVFLGEGEECDGCEEVAVAQEALEAPPAPSQGQGTGTKPQPPQEAPEAVAGTDGESFVGTDEELQSTRVTLYRLRAVQGVCADLWMARPVDVDFLDRTYQQIESLLRDRGFDLSQQPDLDQEAEMMVRMLPSLDVASQFELCEIVRGSVGMMRLVIPTNWEN